MPRAASHSRHTAVTSRYYRSFWLKDVLPARAQASGTQHHMLDMKTANGKRFGQAFSFKKKLGHGLHKGNRKKATLLRKGQIVDNEINELQQKIDAGVSILRFKFNTTFTG